MHIIFNNTKTGIAKLKLISANINSLVSNSKRIALTLLLNKTNPDIILLNETKLNNKHTMYFKSYKIIRNDRRNAINGGGTAIIIRKNIKYETIHINTKTEVLETTAIRLDTTDNNKLILVAIYAKRGPNAKFREELEKIFDELNLSQQTNYYILAGDFNAKHESWSNRLNDERGRVLKSWIDNNDINLRINLLHTATPSYPRLGTYIDLILADARIEFLNSYNNKLETVEILSDHEAIITHIQIPRQSIARTTNIESMTFNYSKANWTKFQNSLRKYDPNIQTDRNLVKEEIISYMHNIERKIINTMEQTIPKPKPQNSTDKYVTSRIRALMKEERQAVSISRKIHRSGIIGPHTRHALMILDSRIKALRTKIGTETQKVTNEYWGSRIEKISPKQPDKIFREINNIFRKKITTQIPTIKIPEDKSEILHNTGLDISKLNKDEKGSYNINNITDKLNILGTQYATANEANANLNHPAFRNIIERKFSQITTDITTNIPNTVCIFSTTNSALSPIPTESAPDYFTNCEEVKRKFKYLNNKKSAGNDKIPNLVLKKLPVNIIIYFTILFNNLLNYAHFPDHWKKAKIMSIPKKGKDNSDPNNYRPISLLSNIGKVYERIINDRILTVCRNKEIIPENQFGFRKNHSTIHAINKLSSDINWALNRGACLGACLIDLEKAFDTVWLNGLIVKLHKKGFPLILIKLIQSMIYGRSFQTHAEDTVSSQTFHISNGLQQGTINSPILFLIYTSDILKLFGPENTGCSLIAFADDMIVYLMDESPKKLETTLQTAVNKIIHYLKSWKLKVNTNKCETILFRPSCKKASSMIIRHYKNFSLIGDTNTNTKIQHKKAVKYLGLLIDDRFLLNKHIETQLQKAKSTFLANARLFYSKQLNKKIKLLCYQLLIRPILTYGCEMWYNVGASVMEELRIFERKCLRTCLSINRTLRSDCIKYVSNTQLYNKSGINRIDNFILKIARNYFATTSKITNNSLIFPIPYPDDNYIKRTLMSGHIPPEAFVFLDKNGYIQDENAIPILYHIPRRKSNKSITYPPASSQDKTYKDLLKYNTAVPLRDRTERIKINRERFWWLAYQ